MSGIQAPTVKDGRRLYPNLLIWAPFVADREVPVFLDQNVEVIEPFTLYAMERAKMLVEAQLPTLENAPAYRSQMHAIAYALHAFSGFLRKSRASWKQVDDDALVSFKESQLMAIQQRASARSSDAARTTVNSKLKVIYDFYWWAQEEKGLLKNHIFWGQSAKIRSNLIRYKNDPSSFTRNQAALKTVYPLLERGTGIRSKFRRQHYATAPELDHLRAHFRRSCDSLTAERNVLMVDVIEHVGWRRGSLQSLTTDQFSDTVIDEAMGERQASLGVTPKSQKRGYSNEYDVRLQLVIRVNRYIKLVRGPALRRIGCDNPETTNALFVSHTTGQRLSLSRITRIISDGFKAIGAGKGVGPHSIRRKFGKDKALEIMQIRQRTGLSVDPMDIAFDLAGYLGQSSLAAQAAYTEGKRDIYKHSIENELRGKLLAMEAEQSAREIEIAALKTQVADMHATSVVGNK